MTHGYLSSTCMYGRNCQNFYPMSQCHNENGFVIDHFLQQSSGGGISSSCTTAVLISHQSFSLLQPAQVTEAFTQSRAFAQLKLPKPGEELALNPGFLDVVSQIWRKSCETASRTKSLGLRLMCNLLYMYEVRPCSQIFPDSSFDITIFCIL